MKIYQIELTNYCNSSCQWCGHALMNRTKGFMDWDIFEQTVNFIKQTPPPNGEVRLHHFGEALLHPHLDQYLAYLEQEGINWRLCTNGRLLCKPEIRKKLLKHQGKLVISLENGGLIEDINQFIKEKSIQGSKLKLVLQTFGDTDFTKIIKGDYEIVRVEKHSWAHCGEGDFQKCCFLVHDWVIVLWDGTIASCCMDLEGEAKLGHIKTGQEKKNAPWRLCPTCEVVLS